MCKIAGCGLCVLEYVCRYVVCMYMYVFILKQFSQRLSFGKLILHSYFGEFATTLLQNPDLPCFYTGCMVKVDNFLTTSIALHNICCYQQL